MNLRVLIVPDWLQWITGTIAVAHMKWNPDQVIDVVPMGVVEAAVNEGWRPWEEFDVVHLLTTQAVQRVGHHFLGKVPTATTLHHVHDEADVPFDISGDAIMVSGSQWEKWLLERGVEAGKIVRVPYGVDAQRFQPATAAKRQALRRKWGIADHETVIGFAGKKGSDNFGRKGFDIFCKGITRLAEEGIPVVPFVLGSGWQEDMEAMLPDSVRRIHVPYIPDQSEIYHVIDFYWVASRIEGGPVPLLEAMASGVVSVCNRVGMVGDVVTDGVDGVIVASGQPEEFAEVTAGLIRDPSRHRSMAQAAREKILSKFDWSKTGPAAAVLYERAAMNFAKSGRVLPLRAAPRSTPGTNGQRGEAMWSLPPTMRSKAVVNEGLNMVRELFRVHNRGAATKAALRLAADHPAQWRVPVGLLVSSWKAETTVALGRWKRQVLGRED